MVKVREEEPRMRLDEWHPKRLETFETGFRSLDIHGSPKKSRKTSARAPQRNESRRSFARGFPANFEKRNIGRGRRALTCYVQSRDMCRSARMLAAPRRVKIQILNFATLIAARTLRQTFFTLYPVRDRARRVRPIDTRDQRGEAAIDRSRSTLARNRPYADLGIFAFFSQAYIRFALHRLARRGINGFPSPCDAEDSSVFFSQQRPLNRYDTSRIRDPLQF